MTVCTVCMTVCHRPTPLLLLVPSHTAKRTPLTHSAAASLPTILISECVLAYIPSHSTAALLRWAAATFPSVAHIDYEPVRCVCVRACVRACVRDFVCICGYWSACKIPKETWIAQKLFCLPEPANEP
jgi:hypothetical protein